MRMCRVVRVHSSCLMTPNAPMLIAGAVRDNKRRRRRRKKRKQGVLEEQGAEYSRNIGARRSRCGRVKVGVVVVIDWTRSHANRASSPFALNEVTCSLAYGDANRGTIRPVQGPQQPTNSSDDDDERMLLQRGYTWLTLMPLLLSLSTGELSFYRGKVEFTALGDNVSRGNDTEKTHL